MNDEGAKVLSAFRNTSRMELTGLGCEGSLRCTTLCSFLFFLVLIFYFSLHPDLVKFFE